MRRQYIQDFEVRCQRQPSTWPGTFRLRSFSQPMHDIFVCGARHWSRMSHTFHACERFFFVHFPCPFSLSVSVFIFRSCFSICLFNLADDGIVQGCMHAPGSSGGVWLCARYKQLATLQKIGSFVVKYFGYSFTKNNPPYQILATPLYVMLYSYIYICQSTYQLYKCEAKFSFSHIANQLGYSYLAIANKLMIKFKTQLHPNLSNNDYSYTCSVQQLTIQMQDNLHESMDLNLASS